MSVKIMARVWAHSRQKGGELLVMLALADFANDAGESWPSIPTLADKSRLAERQTRRVLRNLESAGEIRRVGTNGGRNRRNHYFITVTENPDKITLLKKQGLNNPVICDTKTLSPTPGALNHHRTINKSGANAPSHLPVSAVDNSPKKKSKPARRPDPAQLEAYARFYEVYPRHDARADGLKAWCQLDPDPVLTETIMAATGRYAATNADNEKKHVKMPAGWLRSRRWEDETAKPEPVAKRSFVNVHA